MSEIGGTKLPIQNVRSPVANGGKADNICSLRDLPVLTPSRHKPGGNPAMQQSPATPGVLSFGAAAQARVQ